MSSSALNWAFEKIVPNLKDQVEKLVILRLADRADPAGKCWPGHKRTAKDINVSTRGVQLAIAKLSKLGLLKIEETKGKVGLISLQLQNTVPTEFSELARKKEKKKTAHTARGDTSSPHRGDASLPPGVKPDHPRSEAISPPGGETCSPESPNEPIMNPPLQPVMVVVGKRGEENGIGAMSLVWPSFVDFDQQRVCLQVLAGIDQLRVQQLVDELAGAALNKRINNPASWLRCLVKIDQAGNLVLEHADAISAARTRRAAHLERERQSLAQPLQAVRPLPMSALAPIQSQAQLDERARLRLLRAQIPA